MVILYNMKSLLIGMFVVLLYFIGCKNEKQGIQNALPVAPFPYLLPEEKPKQQLSKAVNRNYDNYPAARPEHNELYTLFKYSEISGFDYNGHDGTISRRDPSKVIFENGKYYVWYTHRETATPPRGADASSDVIPSSDWDLAEIWYATSVDGFNWEEQGVAIKRPPKPQVGWRSVSTADILKWEGKFYLYYQGFMEASGKRGDDCPVTMSMANSPDGPWTPLGEIVIPNGGEGEWDQYSIHDPYPIVYKGKIYLYYKSDFDRNPEWVRMEGLAIADKPTGPFKKHELNPILNSGHETTLFPFKTGMAALLAKDGNEHNTIQYSPDGINFDIASIVEFMPAAGGPYVPDAFTNTDYGKGITWGISHFINLGGKGQYHSMLTRFDCDLSLDVNIPEMKKHRVNHKPDVYWRHAISDKLKEDILSKNKRQAEEWFNQNSTK